MNNNKLFRNVSLLSILLVISCSKDDTVSVFSNSLSVAEPSAVTSFVADLSCNTKDLDKIDMALGRKGVLYCIAKDNPEDAFISWKEGNDNPGCTIQDNATVDGITIQCRIEGLMQDTEYSYCWFFQKRDGTRLISHVSTFRTLPFNPEIEEVLVSDIQCFSAYGSSWIGINEKDAVLCDVGILVSGQRNCNIENSQIFSMGIGRYKPYVNGYKVNYSFIMNSFKSEIKYHCRSYIKYPIGLGQFAYLYGPEIEFQTKNFQEVAVDLGLPSGNLWASYNIGSSRPEEYGNYYAWGELTPKASYTWNNYKWKDDNNKYNTDSTSVYLSSKIELDMEDDAANYNWGGNWHIPTFEDYNELSIECEWFETQINGISGVCVVGFNGNSIFIPYGGVITEGNTPTLKGSYFYTFTSTLFYGAANGYYYEKYPWGDDPLALTNREWTHQFKRSSGFTVRPVYSVQQQ